MHRRTRLARKATLGLCLISLAAAGTANCGRGSLAVRDAALNADGPSGDGPAKDGVVGEPAGFTGLPDAPGTPDLAYLLGTGGSTAGPGGVASGGTTSLPTGPSATGGFATGGTSGTSSWVLPADGGPDDTPDASVMAPLETFCTGEAKVRRKTTIVNAQITAYRMGMAACCSAMYGILFHSQEALGGDGEVMIWQTETTLTEGEHPLSDSWRPVAVHLRFSDDPPDTWQHATGSLRVTGDPAGSVPFSLGLCVQVTSSDIGDPLSMFYVPEVSIAPESWADRLGIYLLEDSEMSATEAASRPLDDLVLASRPLLDLATIVSVTRQTAEIRVQDFGDLGTLIRNEMSLRKQLLMPFVVEADGARIYLGEFVSLLSSTVGPGPYVESDAIGSDRFRVEPYFSGADPRWDPRIVKVLTEASRLVE